MQIIQVVLEEQLLAATEKAAKRAKANRSALIRDALRHYLRQLEIRELEERDRAGYSRFKQTGHDYDIWEREASWPSE